MWHTVSPHLFLSNHQRKGKCLQCSGSPRHHCKSTFWQCIMGLGIRDISSNSGLPSVISFSSSLTSLRWSVAEELACGVWHGKQYVYVLLCLNLSISRETLHATQTLLNVWFHFKQICVSLQCQLLRKINSSQHQSIWIITYKRRSTAIMHCLGYQVASHNSVTAWVHVFALLSVRPWCAVWVGKLI